MAVMIGGELICPFVGRIPARMNEAAFRKGCLACQQKAKLRKQALWGFVDASEVKKYAMCHGCKVGKDIMSGKEFVPLPNVTIVRDDALRFQHAETVCLEIKRRFVEEGMDKALAHVIRTIKGQTNEVLSVRKMSMLTGVPRRSLRAILANERWKEEVG